jgi:hypothetical protein
MISGVKRPGSSAGGVGLKSMLSGMKKSKIQNRPGSQM